MLLALLLGCPGGTATAGKIPVAASIVPLGDFCRKIGGDRVQVTVLIPPGASPHTYEPPPQAVARATQAKVFVYVGAGLDPWAERLAARAGKDQVVVKAVAGLPLFGSPVRGPVEEGPTGPRRRPRGADRGNPHVWLDPVWAQDICRRLASAFIQADPSHRQEYDRNLARYLEELKKLDQEIRCRVAAFTIREFVSFHPSFTYFARRYGLKEVGVIQAAPGREPTPGQISGIIRAIRKYGVRVVFAEPQLSPRVAQVIAAEAGVRVLLLDPLGGQPPYGDDYLRLMRWNLDKMEQAMR